MGYERPTAGSVSAELAAKAHQWWIEAASASKKIDLSGFDSAAPLAVTLVR